jgi:hypothetical protein
MEEPIGENASLLAALYRLVENEKPVLVRYPYVTDARRIASKISGARSWVEALKRFATYPVAIASYKAPSSTTSTSSGRPSRRSGPPSIEVPSTVPLKSSTSSGTNTPPASSQSPILP